VIRRAKEVLAEIESGAPQIITVTKDDPEDRDEMTVEVMMAINAADTIRALSLETLTPIEAMNELYKLKKMLS